SSGAVRSEDAIAHWERHYQFSSGKWAETDYNFETPATSLLANEQTIIQLADNSKYEVYDYPGEYENKGTGEKLTKIRMEEVEAGYDLARSEEHTSELQSLRHLVCRLLLDKKNRN